MDKASDRALLMVLMYHLRSVRRHHIHEVVYVAKRWGIGFGYEFIYGPYSPTLQGDLDVLCSLGVLKVKAILGQDGYFTYFYEITEKCEQIVQRYVGSEHFEKIRQTVSNLSKFDADILTLFAKSLFALEQS